MQQYKKILGKVMMTAEGTYDNNKKYDPISLITDEETGKSYISRKEVPAGTQINNREYWQPVASSGIIDNGVIILNRKNSDGQVPIYDLKSATEAVAVGDRKGGVILGFLGFNPETDTVPTWKLYQYNDVSPSNWTNIDYWLPMDYTNKYAGWFDNEEALYDSVPFPKVGMYAYVGNSASSAVVYRCYNDRVWQPTEDKAFSGVVNLADEEDITSKQNKLKFKDKEYNPAQFSGLGRIYLRKNIVDGKNVLTQTMMQATNTIYIIQYDYDLQGHTINIPEGCTLDFQGGSFTNGTVVGNDTTLSTNINGSCILCDIEGNFKGNYIIDIFGISSSNTPETNSERIKRLHGHISHYKFGIGKYKFSEPISYYEGETYAGIDKKDSVLEFTQSKGLIACSITGSYNQYVIIENMTIQSYDSCIDRNTVIDGLCNNYSCFNNLILKSDYGHCFTQSVSSVYVYSDKYYNIIGTCPNGAVFHNINLWLGTSIDFVCNKTSKYIFYNCYFKECNVSNCNFGWGGNGTIPLHVVYNDVNLINGGSLRQSLNFTNCNFEEFNSNLFVFLNQNSVFDINFDFCDFNMGNSSLIGKEIYIGNKNNGNIEKEEYNASNSNYVPIIGYNINVNCDNCRYETDDTWEGFVFTSMWYSYLKDVKTFENLTYYIFYKTNTLNKLFTKAKTNNKLQVYNDSLKNTAPENTVYPDSEFINTILSSYKPTYFSTNVDGTSIYGNVFITETTLLNVNVQDINNGYTNMYYVIVNKSSVLGIMKTSNYGTFILGLNESVLIYRGNSNTENHVISIIRNPDNSTGRINNPIKGENCFDTTLNKPIWWTGTAWVDANGAEV